MIEVEIGEAASYAAAGVDIHAGDEISRMWYEAVEATFGNRVGILGQMAMKAGNFSGFRGWDMDLIQGQYGLILTGGVDGAGTKPELAKRARYLQYVANIQEGFRDHTGVAQDVMAMCLDDLARDGVEPFGMFMLYDTSSLKPDEAKNVTKQLTNGVIYSSEFAKVVFLNGESAELGEAVGGYGDFNYNLGGFAIGMAHKDRIITGEEVKTGDSIMAIRTKDEEGRGFRSNGFSLVRKVLHEKYGMEWHHGVADEHPQLLNDALRPSHIFTPILVDMNGGYDVNRKQRVELSGVVHVTGGGIPGKLQRLLARTGKGAVIDNPFEPIDSMKLIQEMSMSYDDLATPDPSAYQSLNMGNEMLVILHPGQEDLAQKVAEEHDKEIEKIGEVVDLPGIELKSKGTTNEGEWIRFNPKAA
ncbi:hypothetical protein KDA00_03095 [Candidatus Saccharibacteria bacterium]|nr:hypothetical protein [Candidatus Saccharibacteria bacterium]